MPRDYRSEAKNLFPLPEYPQEDNYDDSVKYEAAVTRFGVDHARVLAQRDEWVDCEQIADIARASEAARAQAEADKRRREAEEAKERRTSEGEKRPKKRGRADTVGSSIAEASTSGGQKKWKVCAYCAKRGKCSRPSLRSRGLTLPRASLRQARSRELLFRLSRPKTAVRPPP
jgi:hypothetical protein